MATTNTSLGPNWSKDKLDMNVERVVCNTLDGDLDSDWNKLDEESE